MISRRAICHIVAAVFGLVVVVPIMLMRLDNEEPIIIRRTVMIPPDVRPGQVVRVVWTADERRSCDGVVHRRFIDSAGVIFDIEAAPTIYRNGRWLQQQQWHNKSFSRDIVIPSGISAGPAAYTGVRRYWCNPLQRLFRGWLGFEIVVPIALVRFNVLR